MQEDVWKEYKMVFDMVTTLLGHYTWLSNSEWTDFIIVCVCVWCVYIAFNRFQQLPLNFNFSVQGKVSTLLFMITYVTDSLGS